MSETPSLEPNQPNSSADAQPESQPEVQPETIEAGDSGPASAVTAAQDAVALEGAEAPTTLLTDEPPALLHDRAPDEPEPTPTRTPAELARAAAARLRIDHVPAVGHAYVGEPVTLHTRVRVLEELPGLSLHVQVPHWVRVGEVHAPAEAGVYLLEQGDEHDELRWEVRGPLPAGASLEFTTKVVVPALDHLVHAFSSSDVVESELVSDATAILAGTVSRMAPGADGDGRYAPAGDSATATATETAVVAIRRKGSYLKFLPAVYERDPFMARFLMLFESFWAPIDGQIDAMADFFDPMLTTVPMLKWLAERMDLQVDDDLPVAVVRKLVQRAVPLYRRRGTRSGLEELLTIYTGGTVYIVERRANNFRLGSDARLGQAVALGVANQPHTFTLYLTLPPIPDDPDNPALAERRRARRRERIRTLVELEKPAHVTYTLELDEG